MAQLPDWQPVDGGVSIPEGSGAGRVVGVVASEMAVASGWGATAALELARKWSAGGEKVILADGALHYPTLHTLTQVENTEGLSDAALFGASVRRVAKPVDGGSFFLITAGTAIANANTVPGSPRWATLLEGFKEAGVKLLLFVRDGDSGCAAFLGSASDIVVLSDRSERPPSAIRGLEARVRALVGPGAVTRDVPSRASRAPAASAATEAARPAEWTASSPEGRGRVRTLALAAIAAIVLLVALFVMIF
ncbi:MAG: CpsD/CapB family tyrosine-protein kinase [Gemmatimonadetes bacterium]|nr:CpsD/CapB family tyrosine-protein kinase [Gemmatimonadota bacterium]